MSSSCYYSNITGIKIDTKPHCIPGLYCPFITEGNPNSIPEICFPSFGCGFNRTQGMRCLNGYKGAQGLFEPVICPRGNYCPTPQELIPCPPKHYCPTGSVQPRKCDILSWCPGGNVTQKSLMGVTACVVLDILLIVIVFIKRKRQRDDENVVPMKFDTVETELLEQFKKSLNGMNLAMNFQLKDLLYHLDATGKILLQNVSGDIHASRMTAIMGPSGAGKTTLMNLLCGKLNRTTGTVLICGIEKELSNYKKIYGFVPQEDIMHRDLTVRENMLYSARIRLPHSWSEKEIQNLVDILLKSLNLYHVQHTLVGDETTRGISGGQRKRVNIGLEIVSMPLCIFLDEPTSGLDATSALEITEMLYKMSRLGMTVVSVIHQPRVEIYKKFDDVLMLTPNGKTAYFGKTEMARVYFESLGFEFDDFTNEADAFMDILSGKKKCPNSMSYDQLSDAWMSFTNSHVSSTVEANVALSEVIHKPPAGIQAQNLFHKESMILVAQRGAGILKQIWYCHNLSLLQQYRSLSGLVLEIFVGSFAGLLMGLAVNSIPEMYAGMLKAPYTLLSPSPFYWPVPQYGLMIGLAVALAASPSGVKIFGEEISIYWRNASAGHSKIAYYLGKTFASLYRIVLAALHMSTTLHFLAAPVIPFWIQFLMIGLLFYGVFGMAAFVSMVVKRENATLLAVVFSMFSAVFCGYGPTYADAKSWKLGWLWNMQFNLWAGQVQYSETLKVYEHIYDSDITNVAFGYSLNQPLTDFSMMILIGTCWRVFAFIAMITFNRARQG